MALPTALTVFNRSMINLENEMNRIKSQQLNVITVSEINANVLYYKLGSISTSQTTDKDL